MGLLGYADLKPSVDGLVKTVNELTKLAKAHKERLARVEDNRGIEKDCRETLGGDWRDLIGYFRLFKGLVMITESNAKYISVFIIHEIPNILFTCSREFGTFERLIQTSPL